MIRAGWWLQICIFQQLGSGSFAWEVQRSCWGIRTRLRPWHVLRTGHACIAHIIGRLGVDNPRVAWLCHSASFCCWESAEEGHPEVDVSGSLASKLSMEYEPDERPGTGNKGSNHDPGIYGVLFPSWITPNNTFSGDFWVTWHGSVDMKYPFVRLEMKI